MVEIGKLGKRSQAGAAPPLAAVPAADWRRWLALPVVLTGTFMIVLDFFIVNVAIPAMQRELSAGAAAIEFVVAGYGLTYAAGLITGGRLGDLYGRRLLFAIGLALFTLASAGCGFAPSPEVLIAGRLVQGAGAALLSPQVLALLGTIYTGEDRTRAFTVYGMVLGIAAVGGQLTGGLLLAADVAGLGWRSCFFINVPIGIIALALLPRLVPEPEAAPGTGAGTREGLDLAGAGLITLGLVAVILPLVEGREQGWPLWSFLCLAASLPILLLFAAYQRRLVSRDQAPLIHPALFTERAFTVGILAVLVFFAGMASYFLVMAIYLQQGLGLSPIGAGAVFSVLGIGFIVASTVASRLIGRYGRRVLIVGALVMAAGLLLLRLSVDGIGTGGSPLALIPALLIDGAGMGLVMAPLISAVLAVISPRFAGISAGVLTTAMQAGNAVGVAIIGIIFFGALGNPIRRANLPHAFGLSLIYLIIIGLATAVLLRLLPAKRG